MLLRNKKTGEIKDILDVIHQAYSERNEKLLMNLEKEWEEALEEPKEYWYIDYNGTIKCFQYLDFDWQEEMQAIGNYFDTREEAEKAVEKLKAWKRLRGKGLEVTEWSHGLCLDKTIVGRFRYEFPIDNKDDIEKDLDLLFSGEDD